MFNDNFYRSSGVAFAIRRITEALPEVKFYFCSANDGTLEENVTWMPSDRFANFQIKRSNPLLVISELIRFRRWLREQKCDLVHCHHRRIAVLLGLTGLPVLYTGHLVFPETWWFRARTPRWMTSVSESVAENIYETTGQKVIRAISNPFPFPATVPHFNATEVKDRAICIARLDHVKAHKDLIAAWKILADRGHRFHLDLIGEGPLRGQLEASCKQLGIADLVHFRGFTTDVTGAIDRCLFATLVSEIEGQGNATLEAAAMGRPSLLTAVPGSIDLVPPGSTLPNGLPFAQPAALADALETWFTHPEQVVEEGKLFFSYLRHTCDPTVVSEQYFAIYQGILAQKF